MQSLSVRQSFCAWLWWQLWHSSDMQRRITAAHSLARVCGWSSELEYSTVRCAIYASTGFEGREPAW